MFNMKEDLNEVYDILVAQDDDYNFGFTNDSIMHYGMPKRSGRYPWGSGENPYQRTMDFYAEVDTARKEGFTWTDPVTGETFTGDAAIYKSKGLTSTEFRNEYQLAKNEQRIYKYQTVLSLKEDGLNDREIAEKMGLPGESSVRALIEEQAVDNMFAASDTAIFLKKVVDGKKMVDVGAHTEIELGISREKLENALLILQKYEGYKVYQNRVNRPDNKVLTVRQKILTTPDKEWKDTYDVSKVHSLKDYKSDDNGKTFRKLEYPASLDSKRLDIVYAEDGGEDHDGIIVLRRGMKDLNLGENLYAQARILVDDDLYLKGMAVYGDNLPKGKDVLFYTNKKKGTPMRDVLKKTADNLKKDPDNPFGAVIKANGQFKYIDDDGKEKLGLMNMTRSAGEWDEWQDSLPSQFLSKQNKELAKQQLELSRKDKIEEYDSIKMIDNPIIKKHYLLEFADGCDKSAVDLKAKALPGQKFHVMIPIADMKDNEIYAPRYKNGEELALVRYPHGGTFEIPILKVNNTNATAKSRITNAGFDAVGVNKRNANILSGADYDGDTVMVLPISELKGKNKITSTKPLEGLLTFNNKDEYPYVEGMKIMSKQETEKQMGVISNLITDMQISGDASLEEIEKAVKHSMVVIDAHKHKLNYKKSEIVNGISELKKKYQITLNPDGTKKYGGASTLISKSKGITYVNKTVGNPKINKKDTSYYDETKPEGALIYKNATDKDAFRPKDKKTQKVKNDDGVMVSKTTIKDINGNKYTYLHSDREAFNKYHPVKFINNGDGTAMYTNKDGTIQYAASPVMKAVTNMEATEDAYTLVSEARHPMEMIYADHANKLKMLANDARKEYIYTTNPKRDPEAAKIYAKEVGELKDSVSKAKVNSVKEREVIRRTISDVKSKKYNAALDGIDLSGKDISKMNQLAITKNRQEVGSISRKNRNIDITPKQWEAIQAGAVSNDLLNTILNNTDPDVLRSLATPKMTNTLPSYKQSIIKTLSNNNYTVSQIADRLNISTSTVVNYLKGENE